MRAFWALFCCVLGTAVVAADDVVLMKPYRVAPGDVALYIQYDARTDEITDVKVTEVRVGSVPQKMGVRKGDFLSALDGQPIAGRRRRGLVSQTGWFSARKSMTFSGYRGLFRQPWSVTIDLEELKTESQPEARAEAAHSAASRTASGPATTQVPGATSR